MHDTAVITQSMPPPQSRHQTQAAVPAAFKQESEAVRAARTTACTACVCGSCVVARHPSTQRPRKVVRRLSHTKAQQFLWWHATACSRRQQEAAGGLPTPQVHAHGTLTNGRGLTRVARVGVSSCMILRPDDMDAAVCVAGVAGADHARSNI